MRTTVAAVVLYCTTQGATAQQPLAASEIIETLPGVWAMETRIPPDSKPALQCEKLAIQIWFENDAKRGLVYVSEALGSAAENLKKEDRQVRSPVRVQKAADGSDGRSIVIQYDGETRLDDKGKPVVWVLVMPDRETFLWHRVDWPFGAFTPPSRRCPARNLVG